MQAKNKADIRSARNAKEVAESKAPARRWRYGELSGTDCQQKHNGIKHQGDANSGSSLVAEIVS